MSKTPSLGVRVEPDVKQALLRAASDDMRSMSSLIEKILIEWLRDKRYLSKPTSTAEPSTQKRSKK